jgi:hypothetical protein
MQRVLIADSGNNRIVEAHVDYHGALSVVFYVNVPSIFGICVDVTGAVYFSDAITHCVGRIARSPQGLYTLPVQELGMDLRMPCGLVHDIGQLLVAEYDITFAPNNILYLK